MDWLILAAFCVFAYLLGSVPFGFIIGKLRGVDIRQHGSRNIGATSCGRVCGKPWGVLAFVLDVAKGFLPVFIILWCSHFPLSELYGFPLRSGSRTWVETVGNVRTIIHIDGVFPTPDPLFYLFLAMVGLCAILGHVFPIWLKFKGGKAVATSLGVLLAMPHLPLIALGAFAVWVIFLLITRYVSVASTFAAVSFAAAYFILYREYVASRLLALSIFVALIVVLVIVRHIPNYRRLIRGVENRVSFRKKAEEETVEDGGD